MLFLYNLIVNRYFPVTSGSTATIKRKFPMFCPLTPSTKAQVGKTLRFLRRKGTKMFNKNSWGYFLFKTITCSLFSTPVYVLGEWTNVDYYDVVVYANNMRIPLPIVCNWHKDGMSKFDRFQRFVLKRSAKTVLFLPRFDSIIEEEDKKLVPCYQTLEQV